jgi:hypothetical protein
VTIQPKHTRKTVAGGADVNGRITTKTNFTTGVQMLLCERLNLSQAQLYMKLLSDQQAHELKADNDVFLKLIATNDK